MQSDKKHSTPRSRRTWLRTESGLPRGSVWLYENTFARFVALDNVLVEVRSCSLLMAMWMVNHGSGAVSIGEGQPVSLCLCTAALSATMTTLHMGPLSQCWGGWREKLTDTPQTGHIVHRITEVLALTECPVGQHAQPWWEAGQRTGVNPALTGEERQ